MLRLSVNSTKTPEEIMKKAKGYFGKENGLNYEPKDNPYCLDFSNALGYVSVTIDGKDVILETREFEHQVKQFARSISS